MNNESWHERFRTLWEGDIARSNEPWEILGNDMMNFIRTELARQAQEVRKQTLEGVKQKIDEMMRVEVGAIAAQDIWDAIDNLQHEAVGGQMKIFMWGVMSPQSKHPEQLHFRYKDAKDKAKRFTEIYGGRREYRVQRLLLEMKSPTHYDVYKHEYKRI